MQQVGVMLSGSTTSDGVCQLVKSAEGGAVREGMLVIVNRTSPEARILARIGEVISHNDFFTVGDAWSESRREGLDIPSDIARRYQICKLELLCDITHGTGPINFPPGPGDTVSGIDPAKNIEDIFNVGKDKPGIVWIGTLLGYTKQRVPVPLNVEGLPMHLGIFGITGSGKSYDTGVLIERLLSIRCSSTRKVAYPMMIVDAHGDYANYPDEFHRVKQSGQAEGSWVGVAGWFRRLVFPSASVMTEATSSYIQPLGINLDLITPRDIADLIVQFYKGEEAISELQVAGLATVLEDFRRRARSINVLFRKPEALTTALSDTGKDILASAARDAIKRAVEKFSEKIEGQYHLLSTKSPLQEETFVDRITREQGVAVIDFSADGAPGVDLPTKQIIVAYLATLLFNRFTEYKTRKEMRYLLFMIEEAQNFCPSSRYKVGSSMARARLSAIATQGRKFGLSLCLITQRPAFVDPVILSMCNTFLIHRVSPGDVSYVQQVTGGLPESISKKLTSMGKGEMIVHGQMATIPYPLLVSVPDERAVKHLAGTTRVVEGIAEVSDIEHD